MTVKELIQKLQEFDQDDCVVLNLDDDRIGCDIYEVVIDPIKMDNGKYDVYLCPKIE
jgi:hypothetical protein